MTACEWMTAWTLNGLLPIHEAAARIESKRVLQHVDKQAIRDADNERRRENYARAKERTRKVARLSSADRVANMMASVKGETA